MRPINSRGFTLFELLLVIAIIAVMASLGMLTYRRHAENQRLDRTALEMQQVLSAALAFNTNNGTTWPEAYDANSCVSTDAPVDTDHFVQSYLPNQQYYSSMGSHFCWSQDAVNPRFWVALPFAAGQDAMAKRLAAILPFGITTSDLTASDPSTAPCVSDQICYVRAEVVQPGAASSAAAQTAVAGVGRCVMSSTDIPGSASTLICSDNGQQKYRGNLYQYYRIQFTCPVNDTGHVLFIPNSIYVGKSGSADLALNEMDVIGENSCSSSSGSVTCDVGIALNGASGALHIDTSYHHQGKLSGSYLAFCQANTTPTHVSRVRY